MTTDCVTYSVSSDGPLSPGQVMYSPPVKAGAWGVGMPPNDLHGCFRYPCPGLEYFLGDQLDTFCEMWQLAEPLTRIGLCDGLMLSIEGPARYQPWYTEAADDLQTLAFVAGWQCGEGAHL